MQKHAKNLELYKQALRVMPGPQSNIRAPLGDRPLFIVKGREAHIWDVDGNEYIDYMCGAGPGIFGYSNQEYLQALRNQLDTLYFSVSGASQTPMEIELAEKITHLVPCAEKVRFCLSGTEAVQLAIRLSRAYTKRRYFIRFEGHYHGWLDNVLGGSVKEEMNTRPFAIESQKDSLYTEGRDPDAFKQSFILPWNNIEVLENVLNKYGEEVAMIIMEPITGSGCCPPRNGYLEKVRDLCTQFGIVLCFDEVVTGFRVALNCAQGLFGVKPDMATFGKALAGGVPMGAVAGKREILDLLLEKKVIGAGTFNGYPYGVAASLASLKILENDNGAYYKKIDLLQKPLMEGLRDISKRHGLKTLVQGPRGIFCFQFIDREVVYDISVLKKGDMEKQSKFRTLLSEEGVLMLWGGRFFVSMGLTKTDVEKTIECFDRAMRKL
jgi:glutamate-1-semialdehyde 2,1-aminomutase